MLAQLAIVRDGPILERLFVEKGRRLGVALLRHQPTNAVFLVLEQFDRRSKVFNLVEFG